MNSLISEIQNSLREQKQSLYEAFGKDYKENNIEIKYALIEETFRKVEDINTLNKETNKTILAIYNGNPYIMLEIIIKGLVYGNNVILIPENEELHTSHKIISIIQEVLKKEEKPLILKEYTNIDFRKILKQDILINRIIYFGDKRKYRQLALNTNIEIKYNGYGSIVVYVDDEDDFEDELYEIEEYASLYNLYVYKYAESINEAIKQINKDGRNDISIILSRDEDKIHKFKTKVNSANILVNEINLDNLNHEIPEELFEF